MLSPSVVGVTDKVENKGIWVDSELGGPEWVGKLVVGCTDGPEGRPVVCTVPDTATVEKGCVVRGV